MTCKTCQYDKMCIRKELLMCPTYNCFSYKPAPQPSREWIPCSERLPKRDELVLISFRVGGEVHFCKYLDDGSENSWWSYIHDCCVWNEDIIAWMPLPEPYMKDGESNND